MTLVVLHNFIHVVVPYTENEKWFDPVNADFFIHNILDHPILGSLSYLGWFGLPMFFFLSGYGLSIKYGNIVPNKLSFIMRHYLKLVLLGAPVIILSNILVKTPVLHIFDQVTLLSNIFTNNWIRPRSFWYLSAALEFYILYALIIYRISPKILLGVAFAITCSFYFFSWSQIELFKYHHIGWILEFSLGVYLARNTKLMKYIENIYVSIALLIILLYSSVNEHIWIFSSFLSVLFFLSIKKYLCNKLIIYIGSISAFLYATHAAVRNVWDYIDFSIDYMNGNVLLIFVSIAGYFLLCILVAVIYRLYYKNALSAVQRKIFQKQ